jgi:hypothetical protein
VVLFACERIPAMAAPAASVDLLNKTREKAADAHTTVSSIWYIFNYIVLLPGQIPLRRIEPMTDFATQRCRYRSTHRQRGPHKTSNIQNLQTKTIFLRKRKMLHGREKCVNNAMKS